MSWLALPIMGSAIGEGTFRRQYKNFALLTRIVVRSARTPSDSVSVSHETFTSVESIFDALRTASGARFDATINNQSVEQTVYMRESVPTLGHYNARYRTKILLESRPLSVNGTRITIIKIIYFFFNFISVFFALVVPDRSLPIFREIVLVPGRRRAVQVRARRALRVRTITLRQRDRPTVPQH